MGMSSARTASLIFIAICLAASFTTAQQQRRGKPPAKTAEGDAKDTRERAAELFEAGQSAHQKGELEKAVGLYGEALERDPSLWQAEFQRAAAYFSMNRLAEAKASMLGALKQLSEFGDAPEARAPSSRAQTLLGEIALAENDPVEAEKSFRRALELNPQATRARTGLAEILLGGGKYAEAIAEVKAAIEAGDDRAAVYAMLGEAQSLGGSYEEALASLSEALKREPKNAIALRRRAEVYLARNDLKAAIEDLRASVEIEPNVPSRLRLAGALAAAKRYDEAVSLYRQILQDEPSNNEARTDLAALYLPAQPEKALEQYQAAAKIEPSQLAHQIGVAASLVKLGRFQEAAGVSRQALAQNQKEGVAYFARKSLATALFKLDDFQNAASEYIRIFDYQRKRGDRKRTAITLYFLGICFDKLGDYEQALKAYEQFMALASADNQLEIDKVNLRLPSLRRQIKEGKGNRKK